MDRGQSTVVGKALEASIVVLYVGLLTTALFGGAVPEYRQTAGAAVADRTLAEATQRVQQAIPPAARAVDARTRVDLPATIAGSAYVVRTEDHELVLDHPDPGIGGRARLAVPASVDRVEGAWESGDDAVVRVTREGDELVVRLEARR